MELFPEPEIVATLSKQLGWRHIVDLIPMREPLRRDFYAEMCRGERGSVRALREKIGGMLYERTGLSRKPEELAKQNWMRCAPPTRSRRTWCSATRTYSTSSASRTPTASRTCRPRSCATSSGASSNSVPASSRGRSGS